MWSPHDLLAILMLLIARLPVVREMIHEPHFRVTINAGHLVSDARVEHDFSRWIINAEIENDGSAPAVNCYPQMLDS